MKINSSTEHAPFGWIALNKWLADLGRSPVTGWRWTREGKIKPTNISGKWYLSPEEQQRFSERAQAGEFAKKPTVPQRHQAIAV